MAPANTEAIAGASIAVEEGGKHSTQPLCILLGMSKMQREIMIVVSVLASDLLRCTKLGLGGSSKRSFYSPSPKSMDRAIFRIAPKPSAA
jgi:hypothetical protein